MKKTIILFFAALYGMAVTAQNDTVAAGKVTVYKDARLDILAKKEAEFNKATVGLGSKVAKGYRLLVVSSNDKNYAMNVRTQLLQRFPEQKPYMSFQPPFIKIKFGDFVEKSEAERYKKMITSSKIVSTNIYLVIENVEVKIDKNKEGDDD
jgi:hypothetical protein